MSDIESTMQGYEAFQPPDPIRLSTGPEETQEIGRLRDDYFDRVLSTLRLSKRAIEFL